MDAVEVLESLEMLGADQWGLVTSTQARENGISRLWLQRLNDRGVLQRLRHGIYALPSSQSGLMQDVQAAWLSVASNAPEQSPEGPAWPAVASGATAAAVHEIGDLVPPYIELSVPMRRISRQSDLRLVRRSLPQEDVIVLEGLPVTTAERTIYDLSVAPTDLDHLTTLVVDAALKPRASVAELSKALDERASAEGHASGLSLLKEMLSTQRLCLDSVGQRTNPADEFAQILAASMSPALQESLRASVSKVLEDHRGLAPEVLKSWAALMKPQMPDSSATAAGLFKIAIAQTPKGDDGDDQEDQDSPENEPNNQEED